MSDQLNAEDQEILEKFNRGELRRGAGADDEMEAARQAARQIDGQDIAHTASPPRAGGQALDRAVLYTV